MPIVYRLVKKRFADVPLDGASSKQYGGRWNSPGVAVIYAADSVALAVCEILVHTDAPELLDAYVLFTLDVPDHLVSILADEDLPSDWDADPAPASTAALGDEWVASSSSLALCVRSTVIRQQRNFLLNPAYPEFETVRATLKREDFVFDPRLK